jgi:ankyrin repeat protein
LIEHGADPNLGNSLGTAPLATASRYGHGGVVQVLLAANQVAVDAADEAGFTALHEVRGRERRQYIRSRLVFL